MPSYSHSPVMVNEVVELFGESLTGNNKVFIDGTCGLGGHLSAINDKYRPKTLYAYDKDMDAIKIAQKNVPNAKYINKSFDEINHYADGILFDLGISSMQIDNEKRGFSYMKDGDLDMRMDKCQKLTAKDVINNYSKENLIEIFRKYGNEPSAKKIASGIVKSRKNKEIKTTLELVEIIFASVPKSRQKNGAVSKKTFQAIRIEVNDEIETIKKAVDNAIKFLKIGGIIGIITFHSLEDKVVQNILKKYSKKVYLKNIPVEIESPVLKLFKKQNPTEAETQSNKRARSATLRSAIKIKELV